MLRRGWLLMKKVSTFQSVSVTDNRLCRQYNCDGLLRRKIYGNCVLMILDVARCCLVA